MLYIFGIKCITCFSNISVTVCVRYNSPNSNASDIKEGSDPMTYNTIRWPLTESSQHTIIQPTKISVCHQMIILSVTWKERNIIWAKFSWVAVRLKKNKISLSPTPLFKQMSLTIGTVGNGGLPPASKPAAIAVQQLNRIPTPIQHRHITQNWAVESCKYILKKAYIPSNSIQQCCPPWAESKWKGTTLVILSISSLRILAMTRRRAQLRYIREWCQKQLGHLALISCRVYKNQNIKL